MIGLMKKLEEVRGRLAKIQCGPLPFSPHNIKGVDPHVLAPFVVSVMNECSRVLQGLVPSVHRPNWIVPDEELDEALSLAEAKAIGYMATHRLEVETPVLALRVENLPDFEPPSAPRIDPENDVQVFQGLIPKSKGHKRATVRLERRRKPPEWDAASPPVHNIEMLTKLDTITQPRELVKMPDPWYTHPRAKRWRHYFHLHGVPYISPSSTSGPGGRRRRFFR